MFSASKSSNNETSDGVGTSKATGNELKCEPFLHTMEDGHVVCNGEAINSSCWTVCIQGFEKENETIGSFECQEGGEWSACFSGDICTICNKVNGSCVQQPNNLQSICLCNLGFAGNGKYCEEDSDLDGLPDVQLPCRLKDCKIDNCPFIPNSGQENNDGDNLGDVCDIDDDNDNITDTKDNCQFEANPNQEDKDSDGVGDTCDNCIHIPNLDQTDSDGDGTGDACESSDLDNDGVEDGDNCPLVPNPNQGDNDTDTVGDACDNCINVYNIYQTDTDENLIGDACEDKSDADQDGISDSVDNCKDIPNGDQLDSDSDELGDECDKDKDGDGVLNINDNCPLMPNKDQADSDGDNIGDVCVLDTDGDSIPDSQVPHASQSCTGTKYRDICTIHCLEGYEKENLPSGIYSCEENGKWSGEDTNCLPKDCGILLHQEPFVELQNCTGTNYKDTCDVSCDMEFNKTISYVRCGSDGNWTTLSGACFSGDICTICNKVNGSCVQQPNNLQSICLCNLGFAGNGKYCEEDSDLDGLPDVQLPCRLKDCKIDNCPFIPNSGQENNDGDNLGDVCDIDDDNDNITDTKDNCQFEANPNQEDKDSDGVGDTCDNCIHIPNLDQTDSDGDGTGDACESSDLDNDGVEDGDNCPLVPNPNQEDNDTDTVGDACDNCINVYNIYQTDTDENLIGDACEDKSDADQDGISDSVDNCKDIPNGDQASLETPWFAAGDGCNTTFFYHMNDRSNKTEMGSLAVEVKTVDQTWFMVFRKAGDQGNIWHRGTIDLSDDYPVNKFLNKTDFSLYQEVNLDGVGKVQKPPKWMVYDNGREIVQTVNGNPGILISFTRFGHVDYSGTFFISDKDDDDIAGLVFGYQSNRHFYVCSWKRKTQSYNLQANLTYPRSVARRGINLMVVDSSTGPGENLRDALWETGNTMNQTHLLWHDDGPQWIAGVAYHWRLLHDPDSGRIRVRWYRGGKLLSDSGNIINKRYQGGRLGMYVFSQEGVHYSKLYAGSPKISNFAMSFNGSIGGNVDLGVISNLLGGSKSGSITVAAWVWIPGPNGKVTCALPPINFGSSHPDLGFLTQSSDDERNWVLRKLKTPTPKTGPSADHTGSGYYAFLETSGIPIGSRASLETPWFAAGDGCNTTFFYHMNDRSNKTEMGSLAVEVKTVDQTWFMVFRKAGDQGNIWHRGTIDLSVRHLSLSPS
ncbi:Thrombospondin-3b [Stylophora pistillata]|uniref:Thrombospondin-3b n=1 Tax=Stylophora pistillata TaxID=50429 RepID=A0A2B4RQ08_STYPI|nr:Thrombospondin-3b [Stylophora pistillata]